MAQVQQQVSTPSYNGVSPENGSNGIQLEESINIPNDNQAGEEYPSSSLDNEEPLQLSPGSLRRRSTRASALKAQEKIKLKDDIVQPNKDDLEKEEEMEQEGEEGEEAEGDEGVATKKRKLDHGRDLDQFCYRFGLRTDDDGDVYAMTDESENSSIHSSEMAIVRAHYEKTLTREMTEEQLHERTMMRKEAESKLRSEEAKLAFLKKMKQSQTIAVQKLAESKKLTANLPNMNNTAYKPIVAPPLGKNSSATSNGKAATPQGSRNAALLALAGMTQKEQNDLLARLTQSSSAAAQAVMLAKKSGNNIQAQQMLTQIILNASSQLNNQKSKENASSSNSNTATPSANASSAPTNSSSAAQNTTPMLNAAQAKLMASQTPQQRSLAARMAFRAQADKQLQNVSAPKASQPDMFFIPNPTQPSFLHLLGLDVTVQRVSKDKTHDKKYEGKAYECEECHIDFTPAWKAIGSSPNDMHLYCEQCVRAAQKRKIRTDHTTFLKKAYQKINAQEKEFEKKIAEGTLEQVFEQARPTVSTPSAPSTSSMTPTAAASRLQGSSSGTSTPKSSTPAGTSTPKPSASSSSSNNRKSSANSMQQQMQQAFMQQIMSNPMFRNPAMLQQMMQMYSTMNMNAQAQARANSMPNMAQMMNFMAQATQQTRANQPNAQQQQQQQQLAVLSSLMNSNNAMMNPQVMRTIQQLSSAQQKQFLEAMKKK